MEIEGQILESYGKIPDPKSRIFNAKTKVFNIKFVVTNKEEDIETKSAPTEITEEIIEAMINKYYRSPVGQDSILEQLKNLGG